MNITESSLCLYFPYDGMWIASGDYFFNSNTEWRKDIAIPLVILEYQLSWKIYDLSVQEIEQLIASFDGELIDQIIQSAPLNSIPDYKNIVTGKQIGRAHV